MASNERNDEVLVPELSLPEEFAPEEADAGCTPVEQCLISDIGEQFPAHTAELDWGHILRDTDVAILAYVMASGDTCGSEISTGLVEDLGVKLSPGTLYPTLDELEKEGVISIEEGEGNRDSVSVADREQTERLLADAAHRHLILGKLFRAVLREAPSDPE